MCSGDLERTLQKAGCISASAEEMRLRGFFSSMALRRSMAGVKGLRGEREVRAIENWVICKCHILTASWI